MKSGENLYKSTKKFNGAREAPNPYWTHNRMPGFQDDVFKVFSLSICRYVYLFRMKQTLNMYELVLKRRQILARYPSETVWNAGVPIFEYFVPQAGKDMSMLWQFYRIRLDCPTMGFDIFCLLNIYCEMLIFCKESWGLSCSLSSFISSHDSSKWIIWCKLRNKLVKKPYEW